MIGAALGDGGPARRGLGAELRPHALVEVRPLGKLLQLGDLDRLDVLVLARERPRAERVLCRERLIAGT